MLGLDLGLGYGFKLFLEGNDGAANIHDVTLTVGLPIYPVSMFYITPSVNLAWTNIPGQDFGEELVVWGGLNMGVDLWPPGPPPLMFLIGESLHRRQAERDTANIHALQGNRGAAAETIGARGVRFRRPGGRSRRRPS